MTTRPEIDASAAELDLRMTEGDPLAFNFLVVGAQAWGASTFRMDVKERSGADQPVVLSVDVTATEDLVSTPPGCDFLLAHAPSLLLTAAFGRYVFDIQEDGGPTRFTGALIVEPQVTA